MARCLAALLMSLAAPLWANPITLSAPAELQENGFLKYVLPRFSLKTSVRVEIVDADAMARIGTDGKALFTDGTTVYHFDHDPAADRFADWLRSDIGIRTIEAFSLDGAQIYSKAAAQAAQVVALELTGDAARGEDTSLVKCGRCHVVSKRNRMAGIGSTPSFSLMRSFPDWVTRFESFYVLKPHAAFTKIEDVTPPFDPERPSPIAPIELSLDDLDDILAFVERLAPANLGAPIKHQ